MYVFYWNFRFSGRFKSLHFAIEAGSMEALNVEIYPLCSFIGNMNSSLRRLYVQIARKCLSLISADLIVSYYISATVAVKKGK